MGLLVYTTFETPEGITIQNVYVRITSYTVDIGTHTTIKNEAYLNREKRLEGRRGLYVPNLSNQISILYSGIPSYASLYEVLKTSFQEAGFTVEDVFESPPVPETSTSQQSSE